VFPLSLAGNVAYALPLAEGGALLVDAGPDLGGTWEDAVALLAAGGWAPRDVRAVIVTHYHLDHAGLAARWAAAGARVYAGALDLPALAGGRAWYEARTPLRLAALARHGAPRAVIEAQAEQAQRHGYGWEPCPEASLEVARDGATFRLGAGALAGDAELRVIAAPGHTPGNLVCHVAATGELLAGDTLLPDTIPTPGLHFPALDGPRWPSLPPYLRSVARLRTLAESGAVRALLPGHGAPVDSPLRLVERFERHHARRAQQLRALLADGGEQSAFELATRLFPRLAASAGGELQLAQATTELIGALDVLHAADEVVRNEREGVARFALAGGAAR
jgi:glyoxylase-like metal-dependent hydrolase (beta-lactamase superfamily II)